jgi:hypothetical protein
VPHTDLLRLGAARRIEPANGPLPGRLGRLPFRFMLRDLFFEIVDFHLLDHVAVFLLGLGEPLVEIGGLPLAACDLLLENGQAAIQMSIAALAICAAWRLW